MHAAVPTRHGVANPAHSEATDWRHKHPPPASVHPDSPRTIRPSCAPACLPFCCSFACHCRGPAQLRARPRLACWSMASLRTSCCRRPAPPPPWQQTTPKKHMRSTRIAAAATAGRRPCWAPTSLSRTPPAPVQKASCTLEHKCCWRTGLNGPSGHPWLNQGADCQLALTPAPAFPANRPRCDSGRLSCLRNPSMFSLFRQVRLCLAGLSPIAPACALICPHPPSVHRRHP